MFFMFSAMARDAEAPFSIESCWSAKQGRPAIEFVLANRSRNDTVLPESLLPWNGEGAIVIVYNGNRLTGRALDRIYPVRDESENTIRLSYGEKIDGKIILDYYFRDVPTISSASDLKVFWSYSYVETHLRKVNFYGYLDFGMESDRCGVVARHGAH